MWKTSARAACKAPVTAPVNLIKKSFGVWSPLCYREIGRGGITSSVCTSASQWLLDGQKEWRKWKKRKQVKDKRSTRIGNFARKSSVNTKSCKNELGAYIHWSDRNHQPFMALPFTEPYYRKLHRSETELEQ